jgi:hypothetical protein
MQTPFDELEEKWINLLQNLTPRFGSDIDLEALIFLIGIQELGKGAVKLTKDQKLDVMHIAICTLLEPYGYYDYKGTDEEGWPHFERTEKLPHLKPEQQTKLMKEAIINYFQ